MTTLIWIYIGGAAVEASIVTLAFFGIRSYSRHLRRKHLLPFISTAISWLVVAWLISNLVFSIFFLSSIAGVYASLIYWILKSPNVDHVA